MMLAARGAAYVYTNAKAIFNLNSDFVNISNGFLGRTYTEEKLIEKLWNLYMVFYLQQSDDWYCYIAFITYGKTYLCHCGIKVAAGDILELILSLECSVYVLSGLCSGICGF